MKHINILIITLCVVFVCVTSIFASTEGKKLEKSLTVINLGGLDGSAFGESVGYLTNNVPLPVRVVSLASQSSMDAVLQAVAKARSENDAMVIAVVSLTETDSMILADADHAMAVVNVQSVRKVSSSKKLMNQMLLRALAAELGVGYSLDPHCVNWRASSPAEFEKLGGNFSPPTLQMVLIGARAHGVKSILPVRRLPAPPVAKK